MICYQNHYQVEKPIEKVFEYFLRKKYLIKGYPEKKLKNVSLKSATKSEFMQENEVIKISEKLGDYFNELEFHVLKVEKNKKILAKLIPGNIYFDNGAIDSLQSEEFKGFTKTNILCTEFEKKGNLIKITETIEIENPNFFDKIKWKTLGFIIKKLNSKVDKKIQSELETLPNR